MWKKILPAATLALAATCGISAQTTDRSVPGHFSTSIVVKVYEVSSIVKMDKEEQRRLAMAYSKQDSLVAVAIAEGRPAGEIDSLDRAGIRILQQTLTQAQFVAWCQHKGSEFSRTAAKGELDYIKEEYRPDSLTYRTLQEKITGKYDFIYQNYLLDELDKSNTSRNIGKLSRMYDNYSLYPMLYSNKYAGDYIEKLNAIKKIPDSTSQRIRAMFYGAIIADKYADWGGAMNRAVQYYLPDTALFSRLRHADFEKQAYELSASDNYNLIRIQHISAGAYDSVYSMIRQKNYSRSVLEYTYAIYHHAKFDSLEKKTTRYYDSLVEAALLRDGSLLEPGQFAIALKYKDLLGLRPTLADTILDQAMFLNARRDSILAIDPYALIDFGPYESAHLTRLLTEEQYNLLLSYKNRAQAIADANSDWNEMELRGLALGLNKEETISQISAFYLLKYNAWNRLAHDKIALWATQRVISESKPTPLKILDPMRWNGDTTKTTNNLKLQW
jgi:hypothetical protein